MKRYSRESKNEEAPLSGVLEEFRAALRSEIDYSRRNASSSAVQLLNGRRIAQVGSNYQYLFDIENVLNLPGDAPGDLFVPGKASIDVIIVSVDGMAITVSVPMDLGTFVPNARLQSNMAHLMRKLIERIESLAGTSNPAGQRVIGVLPVTGDVAQVDQHLYTKQPNPEQKQAVSSSIGRDTTFIWGPPGTGKTWTIGAIGVQLYRRNRSVLVVSHTNVAVDQALLKIGKALAESDPEGIKNGSVIRVGDPKDRSLVEYSNLLADTHKARRSEELSCRQSALKTDLETATAETIELSRQIDICEWAATAEDDLSFMARDLDDIQKLEGHLSEARAELSRLHSSSSYWAAAANASRNARNRLVKITEIEKLLAKTRQQLELIKGELESTSTQLENAEVLYTEVTSIGWLTRQWRRLPTPEKQQEVVNKLQSDIGEMSLKLDECNAAMEELNNKRTTSMAEVEAFRKKYSNSPEDIMALAKNHADKMEQLEPRISELGGQSAERRLRLEELLRDRLSALFTLELTSESSGSAETMLNAINVAFKEAATRVEGFDLAELQSKRKRLNDRIRSMEAELREIEEAFKRIEEIVIGDATVVATTLTRAYLRDSIRSRRFDTVILDEASMAPIPALWVASSLADANAVVVGDPKQLPPIVLSQDKLAQKWLGRDVFTVVGFSGYDDRTKHLVKLKTQYRMNPAISAIPNELIYKFLENGDNTEKDHDLDTWYCRTWGHDTPVLLVDTGSTGAWVTSVSRGPRPSRLNFLSATVCVDLAERVMMEERSELTPGEDSRMLIVCPYRPHARLLEMLLREQNLAGHAESSTREVCAGTAHNFQGSQADMVIFDMVNDDPHWRVGMFIPAFDDEMRRLFNVALTRAKHRLIIVGDFDYISRLGKKAFVGAELMPFLKENYPCVDAMDIVPSGLAARAAKAQTSVHGGTVESDAERLVVTQDRFFHILRPDLANARTRIVIYSPFITQDRLGDFEPQLRAAVERGVCVYVVTKARGDRGKREAPRYRMFEQALTDWGVVVVHKRHMHEKLVFLDDAILWSGSLNPLSFSNTQEIMERRFSSRVVKDFADTLRMNDLVGEFDGGPPACPICGSEIVASEGPKDPFYWRCVVDGCYSRSIDQPPLQDGIIVCANCGGTVEYGDWGGKPHWRCVENRKHRLKIARTHLMLPKMRSLVPKEEFRKLSKLFGLADEKLKEISTHQLHLWGYSNKGT